MLTRPWIRTVFPLNPFSQVSSAILAGVSNTSVVTDPNGTIFPGVKVRIPFQLSEADIDATAILLTDHHGVHFFVETPAGDVMTPASAAGLGAAYGIGTNMTYYRFTLPLALGATPAQAGTWYAVLDFGAKEPPKTNVAARGGRGIRYSFTAQSFTNIRMDARLSQNSLQPGASLTISATLTEYGIPVAHRANVRAELELPDNTQVTLALSEADPGRFQVRRLRSFQESTGSVWWLPASRCGVSGSRASNCFPRRLFWVATTRCRRVDPLRKRRMKTCAS